MLFEALQTLLLEKEFERVSVQDIAERATLNRATFYDHYPDKFALLECMIAEQLNRLISKRGLHFDGCDGALRKVAFVVCDFLSELPCANNTQRQFEMHVQAAMIAAIKTMIDSGLRQHGGGDDRTRTLTATAAAWAVCGAANEWIRTPDRCSTESIATEIDRLVSPLFSDYLESPQQ
jgi:AcrR family transcriptional regulator